MSLVSIALLFGSAILHTAWNLIIKQAGEKYIATWWAMLMGSLLFIPAVFLVGLPTGTTWILLTTSSFICAGYFVVLAVAYNDADFSLVFPIARGASAALIAVWSVLFLREHVTAGGLIGLVVVVMGLVIIGSSGLIQLPAGAPGLAADEMPRAAPSLKTMSRGIWLSLLMALIISVYSVIDGAAVKHTSPLSYAGPQYFLCVLFMTPVLLKRHGWPAVQAEFRLYHWRLLVTGIMIVTAYLLVLLAFRTSVSYSGAIREVGIVIGAIAGWRFLGERFGPVRVVGSVVIFAGILIIALLG